MKAIAFYEYGPPSVLKVEERPDPQPGPGWVRVRVRAASLNAADWHIMAADPFITRLMVGFFKPKRNVLGCDLAGVIDAVGPGVTRFKLGDEVMGELGSSGWGSFAEAVCAPEGALVHKPPKLSFEDAAAAPLAGITAVQALRREGQLRAGERVLINGASGGVGTYALQLAKAMGAHVTAVCSARNVEQSRSLGADVVIDYSKTNFTEGSERYDLILACNGYHPIKHYQRALAPSGRFLMTGGAGKQMAEAMLLGKLVALGSNQKLGFVSASTNLGDLEYLRDRMAEGSVRSVIDRRYPLDQVPAAMTYLLEGHARGKVVITASA
jgi:NADPH:quinone reductase-like Zn-dependent oxidoreductase